MVERNCREIGRKARSKKKNQLVVNREKLW